MQRRSEWLLLAITLAWSTTFVVIQAGLLIWPPYSLMLARFACGTLCLLPWAPRLRLSRQTLGRGLGLALCTFVSFSLQTLSLRYTTVAHAAFASALSTVFVPLFYIVWRRHRATGTYVALLCAGLGLSLLLASRMEPGVRFGDALAAGGAVAFALQIIWLDHCSRTSPWFDLVFLEIAGTAALAALAVLGTGEVVPSLSPLAWAAAAYLGCIATAACLSLQILGQAHTTASRAAFIYALEPVFAALIAWAWAGEVLSGRELAGGSLIVVAALVAERPWPAHWRHRRPLRTGP